MGHIHTKEEVMTNKHSTAFAGAIALAIVGLPAVSSAFGESDEYYYLAAGKGAEIEFYENGNVKKLKGEFVICTRSQENYEDLLKTIGSLGLAAMTGMGGDVPGPTHVAVLDPKLRLPAPSFAYMEDTSGNLMNVYGIPCVLTRKKSRDAETAAIAGNPSGVKFFAFESPWFGPDQVGNPMPLSSIFRMIFEYSSARSLKLSSLASDPWVVVSDTAGENGGFTQPSVSRIPLTDSALSYQRVRPGFPENPCVLNAGLLGPVINGSWEPYLMADVTSGVGVLTVARGRANEVVKGLGTVLVDGDVIFSQARNSGQAFQMQIPNDVSLIGSVMTAQASTTVSGATVLTNALDVVIGSLR